MNTIVLYLLTFIEMYGGPAFFLVLIGLILVICSPVIPMMLLRKWLKLDEQDEELFRQRVLKALRK